MFDESEPLTQTRNEGFCSRKVLAFVVGLESVLLFICVIVIAVSVSYWTIEHKANTTCDSTSSSPVTSSSPSNSKAPGK